MVARIYKSLLRKHLKEGIKKRPHREHRSKRGRRPMFHINQTRDYRKKKESIMLHEIDKGMEDML